MQHRQTPSRRYYVSGTHAVRGKVPFTPDHESRLVARPRSTSVKLHGAGSAETHFCSLLHPERATRADVSSRIATMVLLLPTTGFRLFPLYACHFGYPWRHTRTVSHAVQRLRTADWDPKGEPGLVTGAGHALDDCALCGTSLPAWIWLYWWIAVLCNFKLTTCQLYDLPAQMEIRIASGQDSAYSGIAAPVNGASRLFHSILARCHPPQSTLF